MSSDNLNDLFKNLEHNLDIESPNLGHEQRFLNKLVKQNKHGFTKTSYSKQNLWKPFISIAASIVLLISVFMFMTKNDSEIDLAKISPEMAETRSLFATIFTNELNKINSEDMPEHQDLIVDALFKIKVIEEDYNQLVIGLKESPNDELIISAMIINFQSRIDVLQEVMQRIEEAKLDIDNTPTII